MEPETSTAQEQLFKSIQTFESLQMSADSREKMYRYNDALMQSIYSILEDQEADEQTKLQYLDKTLSQYAAAMKELFPKIISKPNPLPVIKADAEQFDTIVEEEKFNPYHDELGRFSTADSFDQFTITTRDPNKQHWADAAIAREKQRNADGLVPGPTINPGELPKPVAHHPTPSATNTKTTIPEKALATCQKVEAKSVTRKTEKMTLVDDDGNIILEKSGSRGSVRFGGYEQAHMGPTVTLTHNHPGDFGGTFSGSDVNTLAKYDLRAVRAVAKEGTYSLERTSEATAMQAMTLNRDYGKLSNKTTRNLKSEFSKLQDKVWSGEVSTDDANRQLSEYRTSLSNKMHDWLSQNAASYGFNYVFEPSSGGVGKMFEEEVVEKEESAGDFVLDGEFMNGDNWMIKSESDK